MEKKIRPEDSFLYWKTGFVGIALILSGIFFILINFKIITTSSIILDRIFGVLFFVIGIVFSFFQGGGAGLFWFIIPAGVAFTMGSVIIIAGFSNIFSLFAMSIFSGGLGITFLFVFLLRKSQWWALFPVGFLFGVSLWIFIFSFKPDIVFLPLFSCLGIGIAFFCIYFFSIQKQKMKFALISSLIITSVSITYFLIILLYDKLQLVWPLALMSGGILLLFTIYIIEKRKQHANNKEAHK